MENAPDYFPITNDPILNIYSPSTPMTPCYIVGNLEGLKRLKEAVEMAIHYYNGSGEVPTIFSSREDEYEIRVIRVNQDEILKNMEQPFFGNPGYQYEDHEMSPADIWYVKKQACNE